ncbi:MAG: hypothetical protein EKK48_15580 [Candidatus Melainabacteria bacterium]|nr:MAG: hypothetical protein EKK48_15580 [Candidatus Melainabacteria bacterium]
MTESFVFLGVGNVALHLARLLSRRCTIYGTTRSVERVSVLESAGIEPVVVDSKPPAASLFENANVLVSFPPDGATDLSWSERCLKARRIIYISSTGVYGKTSGVIDESSPVDASEPSAARRLKAEEVWRNKGAIILRCPGLYAAESGMHLRINQVKIPGDGSRYVSRIHLDDLARIIEACFARESLELSTYVVGDLQPSTHLETITWLCQAMGAELPDFAPIDQVTPTLRGNRQVDSSRLLKELSITLQYPTYKEGYREILSHSARLS